MLTFEEVMIIIGVVFIMVSALTLAIKDIYWRYTALKYDSFKKLTDYIQDLESFVREVHEIVDADLQEPVNQILHSKKAWAVKAIIIKLRGKYDL